MSYLLQHMYSPPKQWPVCWPVQNTIKRGRGKYPTRCSRAGKSGVLWAKSIRGVWVRPDWGKGWEWARRDETSLHWPNYISQNMLMRIIWINDSTRLRPDPTQDPTNWVHANVSPDPTDTANRRPEQPHSMRAHRHPYGNQKTIHISCIFAVVA